MLHDGFLTVRNHNHDSSIYQQVIEFFNVTQLSNTVSAVMLCRFLFVSLFDLDTVLKGPTLVGLLRCIFEQMILQRQFVT